MIVGGGSSNYIQDIIFLLFESTKRRAKNAKVWNVIADTTSSQIGRASKWWEHKGEEELCVMNGGDDYHGEISSVVVHVLA